MAKKRDENKGDVELTLSQKIKTTTTLFVF